MSTRRLTASEAAARLGVKRSTLYAYVSRGLLTREVALDGRSSLFDAGEVDSFGTKRKPAADGELATVVSTEITRVADDAIWIRGENLVSLISGGAGLEGVLDLVLGTTSSDTSWEPDPVTAAAVEAVQTALPEHSRHIDRLRATVVTLAALDPMRNDVTPRVVQDLARRMLAHLARSAPVLSSPVGSRVGDQLWARLSKTRGTAKQRRALDVALALLIDHGLATSTFAARVAASVRADPYSAVLAGLAAGDGRLHAAASRSTHDLYEAAGQDGAGSAVGEALRSRGRVPGFGHTVYRRQDPRYGALMAAINDGWAKDRRLRVVQEICDLVRSRGDDVPNIDLALGALTWLANMRPDAGETIFVTARTGGWLAHALEEYDETALRFRPRARYVGRRPEDQS